MKKQIFPLLMILLLGSVLATSLYAGETTQVTLSEDYVYYVVLGNNSFVDVEVIKNGSIVSITPNKYMKEENLTITFYNQKDEEIEHYSGGGGGGWVAPNKKAVIIIDKNETIQVEQPKEVNPIIPITNEEKSSNLWIYISLGMVIIFLALIIWRLIARKIKEEESYY